MCTALALPASELPDEVLSGLSGRVHTRGDQPGVRFYYRQSPALLPVWLNGTLQVARWGNKDRGERRLPPTGWTWKETVEAGRWKELAPEPVDVPACYGLANGVWFKIKQGVRGLLVRTQTGTPVVYPICEPSTRYYRVMTRAGWMSCPIGEVI